MAHPKTTSRRVARRAARILRSPRASKVAKSVAASALGQRHRSVRQRRHR